MTEAGIKTIISEKGGFIRKKINIESYETFYKVHFTIEGIHYRAVIKEDKLLQAITFKPETAD